ncbi:kinesin-domain-containing protein [Wolfiporia cocos MD-104 SS10]|uniref:Kinesin-like protein n=1 Tax=Wolfiporia cocos (strain MD-104) TaxID=742152 RepID=A0A2H3J6R2_WOLCO|nr:kinesin-domain-containing protein [Wolfiporia cocos MD-104 SS10]
MASNTRTTAARSVRTKTAASAAPSTTRTTRAASRTSVTTARFNGATAEKATARRPLNSCESSTNGASDLRDPTLKAFLRIRPHLGHVEPSSEPYLEPISDTAVRMTEPNSASSSHSHMSTANPSSVYTFSHIFPPETLQNDFFNKTTLPLVKDLLEGQSGLLFAYGVTNSGKTYTIQGGTETGSAGIIPRTLDVIFNSIQGLHGDGKYRPVRLNGIELADESSEPISLNTPRTSASLADILDDLQDNDTDIDPTTAMLDRNHEYTVWLSYAEVYNEKVYDLFASVDSSDGPSTQAHAPPSAPRPTSLFLNMPVPSSHSQPLLLTRKALQVKPCPASDTGLSTAEAGNAGKYIAGLRQIRVQDAKHAKALLRLGQLHRRVFGTLANSQSSRSHALVTIKVLRVHRGERNDPSSIQTSRLTLVDLAGSERTKHTQTSGERLREAGNINKSLMVLGQCLETLRANQRQLARSLATSAGRMDTRDVKRGLAIVPFRHSKLTEVLMDYFVGEARAVMIVNVNPYDTGFDENSHVMRFAALAREVSTAPTTAVARPLPVGKEKHEGVHKARGSDVAPHRRKVTISMGGQGRKISEAHLEVLEEDEEPDDGGEEGDEPIDPLVDALFDEIERLRTQLYEAEMRAAIVEAETREEVMQEMQERMRSMEEMFTRRLMKEVEQSERRMDAKIDMMKQTSLQPPSRIPAHPEPDDEIEDFDEAEEVEVNQSIQTGTDDSDYDTESHEASSPLANKTRSTSQRTQAALAPSDRTSSGPEDISEFDDEEVEEEDEETVDEEDELEDEEEEEEIETVTDAAADDSILSVSSKDTDTVSEEESLSESESEPESEPSPRPKPKSVPKKPAVLARAPHLQPQSLVGAPSPIFEADVRAGHRAADRNSGQKLPSLEQRLRDMSLHTMEKAKEKEKREEPRNSIAVIPNRKARQQAVANGGEEVVYVPRKGEVDTGRKKKR